VLQAARVMECGQGEIEIARLSDIETRLGETEAITAWKSALEDPDSATDFIAASIWAAIRERHGGVLRTPFAVLVAEQAIVDEALLDQRRTLSVRGYLPRMHRSFGEIYLGLDAGRDGAYERESAACNDAIMSLDKETAFERARKSTRGALKAWVDEAISYATFDGESSWDLTLGVGELVDPLLADFCEEWFGLSEDGGCFRRGGYRWDWQPGQPPTYPGHFLAPSRYFFQPRPGKEVRKIGAAHGVALRSAMLGFLRRPDAQIHAPIARAILDSPPGQDLDFAARTLVGAVIGFVPTVDGNILRILDEWLREGTLWSLRARLGATEATGFLDAWNRLGADFIPAMQLRAMPELIWRTATVAHTLGVGPHRVDVNPGDVVVAAAISATQQSLELGRPDLHHVFGGNRKSAPHPTHACPGADPALAMMLGFFSALVESDLALRAGPGPLTLAVDGRLRPADARLDQTALAPPPDLDLRHLDGPPGIWVRSAHAFEIRSANIRRSVTTTALAAIGNSWLFDLQGFWYDLVSSLRNRGYDFKSFASPGRLLAEMASDDQLSQAKRYLRSPGANPPRALLIGGGGNDVVYESPTTSDPAPLFRMLAQSPQPGDEPLVEAEVRKFIDIELFGYYTTIIDTLTPVTNIPILIHAYDHPIPDGRGIQGSAGPWLQPIFAQRGYNIPNFPASNSDLILARSVMLSLIDRLNDMVARVAAAHPNRVYHVKLTGTLKAVYGNDYTQLWANELHPNERGFDLLAAVIAKMLRDLNIG
jgi:hypothetical protein